MSRNTVERAAQNVRRTQSPLALRKESLSAFVVLVAWVATLITDNIDSIPVAGTTAQIVGTIASIIAVVVARFTVPALTQGQQQKLVAEAERIETADADAARPVTLPVYTGPTVEQVTNAD